MAERPYFYVSGNTVRKHLASFEWFGGFAVSQKQKCIDSMHFSIKKDGFTPLEVSTKSKEPLGVKLSAFNLKLNGYPLENIFQSAKVFENGGPYLDLLTKSPKDAKRDERLRTSGMLKTFRYDGKDWPLIPKTVFYDFIYYNAVRESLNDKDLEELVKYNSFTDIEFNPNRSINTQARSVAIVALIYNLNGCLPELTPDNFLRSHQAVVKG